MFCSILLKLIPSCIAIAVIALVVSNYSANLSDECVRTDNGEYVKQAHKQFPRLAEIEYTRNGVNDGIRDSNRIVWREALRTTIMESKAYQIYDIHPYVVWGGCLVLVMFFGLLSLLLLYKYKSDLGIADTIAKSTSTMVQKFAKNVRTPAGIPAVEDIRKLAACSNRNTD